jgi:hypothetical protein
VLDRVKHPVTVLRKSTTIHALISLICSSPVDCQGTVDWLKNRQGFSAAQMMQMQPVPPSSGRHPE